MPDRTAAADDAMTHFGPDPAYRTCVLRPPVLAGVGQDNVDPFGDHCDAHEAIGSMASGVRSSASLQVQVNWTETTAVQVHLVAAGLEASGEQSPITLDVPPATVDDTFAARVRVDGASLGDRFTLTFRVLPDPGGPGRPF